MDVHFSRTFVETMNAKKKICWITADCFADCDFTPIDIVSKKYDVEWILVLPLMNPRYQESEFEQFKLEHFNVHVKFFYVKHRIRDLRRIIAAYKLGKMALNTNADIYYVNAVPSTPWYCALWYQLPIKKRIVTAHQGMVHEGMKYKAISKFSRNLIYRYAPVVNMFSNAQSKIFKNNYPMSRLEVIPLSLKDYGIPSIKKASGNDDCLKFLFFGLINYGKNVDLLIDAACNLYDKGTRGFKVLIYGTCKDWSFYQKKIKYPEIFDIFIGFIENSDIPNLISQTHYLVQPYRAVSQSGVMKLAFQYDTPVIVSKLPGFTDELVEGLNGFSFKVGDVADLEFVMKERIENFHDEYDNMVINMAKYTHHTYSSEYIGSKYIQMFDNLIK